MRHILVIKHPIHGEIGDDQIQYALDDKFGAGHYYLLKTVTVCPEHIELGTSKPIDWPFFVAQQQEVYDTEIRTLIEMHREKTVEIAYFGFAPIPLAVHLGYLIGNGLSIHIFQLGRAAVKTWSWPADTGSKNVEVDFEEPVWNRKILSIQELAIRLSCSFNVDKSNVVETLDGLEEEISIVCTPASRDNLVSEGDVWVVASKYEDALDAIIEHLPNAKSLHLLAAVPNGLAFALGVKTKPNVHPTVKLYQYARREEGPNYDFVFNLQQGFLNEGPRLDETAIRQVVALRTRADESLTEFKKLIIAPFKRGEKGDANSGKWIRKLQSFLKSGFELPTSPEWESLSPIDETQFWDSSIICEEGNPADQWGFSYDKISNTWRIGDGLVYRILLRFAQDSDRAVVALRQFILHECVHSGQGMEDDNVRYIRLSPKILEEADYLADSWAHLHELTYYYLENDIPGRTADYKQFFVNSIETALETMSAFFDVTPDGIDEVEYRRLNRFLIWYFHLARIKNIKPNTISDPLDYVKTIVEYLRIKPKIEIIGLSSNYTNDHRQMVSLRKFRSPYLLEIAVYHDNRLCRAGSGNSFDIKDFLHRFSKLDHKGAVQMIETLLRNCQII